jgi:hypothetical protein
MSEAKPILCDGCGQPASSQHTARRLVRLEWATRFRPIHLHTLLLGAVAPARDAEFFYYPDSQREGEAAVIASAAGTSESGDSADSRLAEFQRRGFFATHVLECPLNNEQNSANALPDRLNSRLPVLFTRIRRSLKPKRLVLISKELDAFIDQFASAQLGCELVLDNGRAFALDDPNAAWSGAAARLQGVLAATQRR